MRNYSLLVFFGLCCATLHAQQQVVATSGNAVRSTLGSISWTLGEPVVAILTSSDKVLTQGFQQSSLEFKTLTQDSELKISIWPNPTSNWVTLSIENPDHMIFRLFDPNGKLLKTHTLNDKTTVIDFNELASGAYQIKLVQGKKELKTITVIKQ